MASFSTIFPFAYHVAPLHALRGIVRVGALRDKDDPSVIARPTSIAIDRALGFVDVVHFYLASDRAALDRLPLLRAQLGPSRVPPFPYVALELPTAALDDADCVVCAWNIAMGRPTVPGVCRGGIWVRRAPAARIAAVWDALRAQDPPVDRARGVFNAPYRVPTLIGPQLMRHRRVLARQKRGTPELLLRPPVMLDRFASLVFFDPIDRDQAAALGPLPLPTRVHRFPGYDAAQVDASDRAAIAASFADPARPTPDLPHDRVRPRRR
ncbi:MAG: hypothetical protein AAF772_09530 [Acidobacteriota bacterium]